MPDNVAALGDGQLESAKHWTPVNGVDVDATADYDRVALCAAAFKSATSC